MEDINLIKTLEHISSKIPNRVLKVEGYILKGDLKEKLEIIIFKGFSSSTTHPIEIDLEKNIIEFDHFFTNSKLYEAPLSSKSVLSIRESENLNFFLNIENWI